MAKIIKKNNKKFFKLLIYSLHNASCYFHQHVFRYFRSLSRQIPVDKSLKYLLSTLFHKIIKNKTKLNKILTSIRLTKDSFLFDKVNSTI